MAAVPNGSTAGPVDGGATEWPYNVRDYQNPDAGAAETLTKPSKGNGNAKAKTKKGGASQHVCFRCGKASAKCRACGQCQLPPRLVLLPRVPARRLAAA